jgi:hypothetical protein
MFFAWRTVSPAVAIRLYGSKRKRRKHHLSSKYYSIVRRLGNNRTKPLLKKKIETNSTGQSGVTKY